LDQRSREHLAERIYYRCRRRQIYQNLYPRTSAGQQSLFSQYAAQARQLIAQGVQVVVVPEKLARIPDASITLVDSPISAAARHGAIIIIGIERWMPTAKLNEARVYTPEGRLQATYEKHHMLPAFESDLPPGTTRTVLQQPSGEWGVEICKDMDFPALSRQYGNDGVGLLLVPAWDFVMDGWLHDRMALMRGVESGFTIARAAKQGLLTVSDDRGRVLAEQRTDSAGFATLMDNAPVHHDTTIYDSWGDWFAWLNVLALVIIWITGFMPAYRKLPSSA
jgi:apolipoprotein N-acyltransferase